MQESTESLLKQKYTLEKEVWGNSEIELPKEFLTIGIYPSQEQVLVTSHHSNHNVNEILMTL